MNSYQIREFEPQRDIEGIYKSFVDGFYHILWPIIDHAEQKVVKDLILYMNRIGNKTYVAEAEGEARGILVGGLPFEVPTLAKDIYLLSSLLMRFSNGSYSMTPFARANIRRVVSGFLPFIYLHPISPSSETLLLTSQKDFRGGIGSRLMDAWLSESLSRGYKRTTVCTDSKLSWDFYENYGFKKVREFKQKAYDFSLPGEKVTGFIYSMDIA